MLTKVLTEATTSFESKLNDLVQEMARNGYVYKDMKLVDNQSSNKITAIVLFEKNQA